MNLAFRGHTEAGRLVEITWEDGVLAGDDLAIWDLEFHAAGEPRLVLGPGIVVKVDPELKDPRSFAALCLELFSRPRVLFGADDLFANDEILPNESGEYPAE